MDQATAVVWAAGVAGFSSALGAALGAAVAGRAARQQVHHAAQREKLTRYEVALAERFSCFKDKVNEAISALYAIEQALIDDEAVTGKPARKACFDVRTSYDDDVWSSSDMSVIQAAGTLNMHLEAGLAAIEMLIKTPQAAKDPESDEMQRWISCRGDISTAYQHTSRLMGEILRGTEL